MRFVICLTLCHFVLVFFSPFSFAITSLGEERANLSAFRMFDRFVLVWICRFPLPLGVWEGLRFVIVALLGLFSYLFWYHNHCRRNYTMKEGRNPTFTETEASKMLDANAESFTYICTYIVTKYYQLKRLRDSQ